MKVKYNPGKNTDFDYYVVGKKTKKIIDSNSLINKLENETDIEVLDIEIDGKRYSSNKDYLIKGVEKETQKTKYFTCDENDIEFIKTTL